jgi:hypothetical protein
LLGVVFNSRIKLDDSYYARIRPPQNGMLIC